MIEYVSVFVCFVWVKGRQINPVPRQQVALTQLPKPKSSKRRKKPRMKMTSLKVCGAHVGRWLRVKINSRHIGLEFLNRKIKVTNMASIGRRVKLDGRTRVISFFKVIVDECDMTSHLKR